MKYIAIIGAGLVLLAAICVVVIWSTIPKAKLTVHAVSPTGTNFTWSDARGTQRSWPVWEVCVTNRGHAPAVWYMTSVLKDAGPLTNDWRPMQYAQMHFVFQPGHVESIYTPMPSDSTNSWMVELHFKTQLNNLDQRLSSLLKPVPPLQRLLLNSGDHVACDVWHSGTNVTSTR
jgi:hypothetical protein